MSLNRHDSRCPSCGSPALDEMGRVEGGFEGGGGDAALMTCTQCGHVWDTDMPHSVPKKTCGARATFWPEDEACEAECIRRRGHAGTIHEDEILGEWNEDDLPTHFPTES